LAKKERKQKVEGEMKDENRRRDRKGMGVKDKEKYI